MVRHNREGALRRVRRHLGRRLWVLNRGGFLATVYWLNTMLRWSIAVFEQQPGGNNYRTREDERDGSNMGRLLHH